MAKMMGIYRCEKCGNVVEVLHEGIGELTCCGQTMKLYKENTVEAAFEKHIPVIEKTDGGVLVKVGSVAHPMVKEHYIEWIQILQGEKSCRQFLKAGDVPEVKFEVKDADGIVARAYCNLHGLWKG